MARNIVLAVATLAVLVLAYFGYVNWVGEPVGTSDKDTTSAQLPEAVTPTTQAIDVGGVAQVQGGGRISFVLFEPETGRARSTFSCENWQPIGGTSKEIHVAQPEMTFVLPSGVRASLSADEGQIEAERLDQEQIKPRVGWFSGNVKIVVDRGKDDDQRPAEERPEDVITANLDRVAFDIKYTTDRFERAQIDADGPVRLVSDDFEIAGTGLHLTWSQAENRLEKLDITKGEYFVLYALAGFLKPGGDPNATSQPAIVEAPAPKQPTTKARPKQTITYAVTLGGEIIGTHTRGDQEIGSLAAREIALLVDSAGIDRVVRGERKTTSRPAKEQRDKQMLRWSGPLSVVPTQRQEAAANEPRRVRFEATGSPVVMMRKQGVVRCARIVYHDDALRFWLYPTEAG